MLFSNPNCLLSVAFFNSFCLQTHEMGKYSTSATLQLNFFLFGGKEGVKTFAEKVLKVDIFNQTSGRDSAGKKTKNVCRQPAIASNTRYDTFIEKKPCLIINHFIYHTCKYHA